jgi:hypothetical protein
MINACLEKVPLHPQEPNVDSEKVPLNQVPWHHLYNISGEDGKPTQLGSWVQFGDAHKNAFDNTFFKRRADKYVKDYSEGDESFFFSKMWVQWVSVFPRLIAHDLWFISEWHAFFQKITEKIGWGTVLMTSFIGFPFFIGVFALFNLGASLYSWGESVIALYNQLNIYKDVKRDVETTDKDIDCSVQTIIKNAIILFFYTFVVPVIGLLTVIPTLGWFAMTLLITPLYALYLPSNIYGEIVPMFKTDSEKDPKLTKMFAMFNVVLSNIYSYAGGYLIFFSVVYSIIAGLKQDLYAFIGCLVAIMFIFGVLKWYKSAAPDIPETSGGSAQPDTTSLATDQPVVQPHATSLATDQPVTQTDTTSLNVAPLNVTPLNASKGGGTLRKTKSLKNR